MDDPKSHFHAMKGSDASHWQKAELKEIANMKHHQVWVKQLRRDNNNPIASKWAYRKKLVPKNQIVEYKARICAQGFCQTFGVNFKLKYTPTGKEASLRLLLLYAVNKGLEIHQLDVQSVFLTCPLDKTVMLLPPARHNCPAGTIFELKKAIYRLKQASLVWYKRPREFFVSIGFAAALSDLCVFYQAAHPATWIYAHINDLVIISQDPLAFKNKIEKEFEIKYLRPAAFRLGIKINHSSD
jgi:hypothetical protein